jgi:ribosomal protein S1
VQNVRLSFTFPELSCALIEEGERYPIIEGPREVGTLRILVDAWKRIEDIIRVGEGVTAIVTKTTGTLAFIALPKGGTSMLSSADVGLRPWDDIADRLQTGDMVTVRILDVDLFHRRISVEVLDNKPLA